MEGTSEKKSAVVSGKGKWLALKVEVICFLMIVLALLTLRDYKQSQAQAQVNLDKQIPFKCTACSSIEYYKIRDLQKIYKPEQMRLAQGPATQPANAAEAGKPPTTTAPVMEPMMGPMTLQCKKCGKKTLTQAVECPKCQNIFVMKMDPAKGLFDDKCPKCGESYAKAWQEKYRKSQGTK